MAHVNLLPWRQRERTRRQRLFAGAALTAFATACVLVGFAASHIDGRTERERQRGALLAQQLAAFEERVAAQEALGRQRDELAARTEALRAVAANRPLLAATLDELAQKLAAGVHYTALRSRDGWVTATGVGAADTDVAELVRRLRGSAWFTEHTLKHIGAVAAAAYGDEATAFELTFRTAPPASAATAPAE